ncbi:hypothetical protein [Pyrodictium delaneyi]|nr:hypothetical protein [Pyrodictium delaneyi]
MTAIGLGMVGGMDAGKPAVCLDGCSGRHRGNTSHDVEIRASVDAV